MFRSRVLLSLAIAGLAGFGSPATAGASPVIPEMDFDPVVTIRDARGKPLGYKLCARGDASFLYVFGAWDFRIDGSRASLTGAAGPVVTERDSEAGTESYGGCLTAYRLGYVTGHVHATFSYNGVGGNVPHTIEHTFTWCDGCPAPTLPVDLDEGVESEVDPV